MVTKLLSIVAVSVSSLGLISAPGAKLPLEQREPKTIAGPSQPVSPGTVLTLTVYLDDTASNDTPVAISTNDYSEFSSIPSSITVAAGTSSKDFQVTINPYGCNEIVGVTATANGGHATGYIQVSGSR